MNGVIVNVSLFKLLMSSALYLLRNRWIPSKEPIHSCSV